MTKISEVISAKPQGFPDRCVMMWRTDGLCQRIVATINGLIIASENNLQFRLAWPNSESMKARFSADYQHPNDTPEDPREIFSTAFIEKYFIEDSDVYYPSGLVRRQIKTRSVAGREEIIMNTRADFDQAARSPKRLSRPIDFFRRATNKEPYFGLAPNFLDEDLIPDYLAKCRLVARSGIFSPEIEAILDAAENRPELRNLWAVHLRSGDVIYGETRKKFPRRLDFSLSTPVAMDFCQLAARSGKSCVVVGATTQDIEKVRHRCSNAYSSEDIGLPDAVGTLAVIQDVSLMSQCERIFSSESSSVVRLANYFGKAEWIKNADIYSKPSESNILRNSLRKDEGNAFNDLQKAYIYYNLFVLNWDTAAFSDLDAYLIKAYKLDRENQSYLVLRYLNCLSHSEFRKARLIRKRISVTTGTEGCGRKALNRKIRDNIGFHSKFMENFLIHIYRNIDLPEMECRLVGSWIDERYSVSVSAV